MSQEKIALLSADHPIAARIAKSLGLGDLAVSSLSLNIDAGEGEIAKLEGRGVIMGEVTVFYSSELEDEEESEGE